MSISWESGDWIAASWDKLQRGRHVLIGIEEWIFRERSEFQEVVIAKVPDRGKGLFLDAVVEFLEIDEFVYHESMALPPLLYHPAPRRVLIEGGGDGLVLREVLRDPRVEEVVMVELDGLVIEACREHLKDLHRGSFDDPRATILVRDVFPYLESSPRPFDVIFIDLLDAYDTLARELYDKVLGLTRDTLAPGGVIGSFGELARPHWSIRPVYQGLRRDFAHLALHRATIETFSGEYGFVLASNEVAFHETPTALLEERASDLSGELRAIVPGCFPACFRTPRYVQEAIDRPIVLERRSLGEAFRWLDAP